MGTRHQHLPQSLVFNQCATLQSIEDTCTDTSNDFSNPSPYDETMHKLTAVDINISIREGHEGAAHSLLQESRLVVNEIRGSHCFVEAAVFFPLPML